MHGPDRVRARDKTYTFAVHAIAPAYPSTNFPP